MNRRPLRCQPSLPADEATFAVSDQGVNRKQPSAKVSLLDICRCPKCNGPMTARHGKSGPYFHCLCHDNQFATKSAKPKAATPPAARAEQHPAPSPARCEPTPSPCY